METVAASSRCIYSSCRMDRGTTGRRRVVIGVRMDVITYVISALICSFIMVSGTSQCKNHKRPHMSSDAKPFGFFSSPRNLSGHASITKILRQISLRPHQFMIVNKLVVSKPLQGPGPLCTGKCWLPYSASYLALTMLTMVEPTKREREGFLHLTVTTGAVVVGQTHMVGPVNSVRNTVYLHRYPGALSLAEEYLCQGKLHH
jgi:hypothetical protein